MLENLVSGLAFALSMDALIYCAIGVTLGTFIGMLPGIGPMAAIAMLVPLTYYVDPAVGIIMLAGIYYGAAYGGSTASILLNLPGTANTAITCLDGYPMTQQGRAGIALFMTTIASFFGSICGLVILVGFAPSLSTAVLAFGSPEYFSLVLLGLLASALAATDYPLRAVAMIVLGLLLGSVGADQNTGITRFTFDSPYLYDGFTLVAFAVGLFGIPEIISNVRTPPSRTGAKSIRLSAMLPTREDWRRSWLPMIRGTSIGAVLGALPGTGGTLATILSYSTEKRVSRRPEEFGYGAIEGVTGPESANNAAIQTAFIPTLTLGIPGDAVMALIVATLMIHGIQPGPLLVSQHPTVFWGLAASFLVGNVLLLILNIPLIGLWIRILSIPYKYLFPAIIVFVCIGAFSINTSPFDIYMVSFFGALGYGLRLLRCPPAPLLMGLILGPMLEVHLRRALQIANGDPLVFVERPISAAFLMVCVALIAAAIFRRRKPGPAFREAKA
ncbi:tripartite tricarboxylate transporter permease [Geminicoccaceae bacterium 1502E]|nr:tripartite tricarboxylate transporter permease [Geminicoccaceae bacterium 1502E]